MRGCVTLQQEVVIGGVWLNGASGVIIISWYEKVLKNNKQTIKPEKKDFLRTKRCAKVLVWSCLPLLYHFTTHITTINKHCASSHVHNHAETLDSVAISITPALCLPTRFFFFFPSHSLSVLISVEGKRHNQHRSLWKCLFS